MGIIILLSVFLSVCITLIIIGTKYWDWEILGFLMVVLTVFLGLAIIGCSISCICTQVKKDTYIYEMEQDREALVESYNTYYNNYDKDLAHSQSLKEIRAEIAEFNAKINKNNYFCDNFFVNWFYIDCTEIEPISITNGTSD